VAFMGETRGACMVLVGKPEGKRLVRRPGLDGRMILKWMGKNFTFM
jgi:hypothetical protein